MKQILKKTGGVFLLVTFLLTGCQISEVQEPILKAEGIRKITISEGKEVIYSISYEPKENEDTYEYWKMAVPYEDKVIVDTEAMLKLYEALETLDFTEVEAKIEDTGLEGTEKEIAIEFCQAAEDGNVPSAPKADSRCVLQIGNSDGKGNYYTSLKSRPQTIYRMDQNAIDSVMQADTFSLILKVGAMVPISTVKEVSIRIDGNDHVLSFDGENYYLNGQKTGEDIYKSLYTELLSVLLEKEIPENSSNGSDSPELHIAFKRNTDKLPDVTVDYYAYDDTYAVLSVDGVENFLVKQADVDNLIKAVKHNFS